MARYGYILNMRKEERRRKAFTRSMGKKNKGLSVRMKNCNNLFAKKNRLLLSTTPIMNVFGSVARKKNLQKNAEIVWKKKADMKSRKK